jgi:hypothetical protein
MSADENAIHWKVKKNQAVRFAVKKKGGCTRLEIRNYFIESFNIDLEDGAASSGSICAYRQGEVPALTSEQIGPMKEQAKMMGMDTNDR